MSDPMQPGLFGDDPEADAALAGAVLERAPVAGVRRVLWPNRTQIELRPCDLDSLLPEGHRARLVWAWVERADLSAIYAGMRAVEGGSGRSAIAPEILFALWLYATLQGVGSARALARLTLSHDAYRWICGGVNVNYHTLSDFRTAHGEALDGLLTDSVALLLAERVVSLKRQVEKDPSAQSWRRQAARERAARERQERLARLPEMAEIKAKQGKPREEARVSSSDPEATVMKMGDGGFRPAYNAQFTTDTETQVIVGVEAASVGTDSGRLTPMREQVAGRYGQHPEEWLVDGGYATHEQIEQAAAQTAVFSPLPKARDPASDPHARKDSDSTAVAAWRERMGTEEAKAIYPQRAATAECVNALARQRGLIQLRVRGTAKVRCILLLHALAHNLMRTVALAPQLLGWGGASGQPLMAT